MVLGGPKEAEKRNQRRNVWKGRRKVCLYMGDTIKCIENAKEPNKQNKQKPYLNSEFGKTKIKT